MIRGRVKFGESGVKVLCSRKLVMETLRTDTVSPRRRAHAYICPFKEQTFHKTATFDEI